MIAKNCPACDTRIHVDCKYCPICGYSMVGENASKNRRAPKSLYVLVIIALVLSCASLFMQFSNNSSRLRSSSFFAQESLYWETLEIFERELLLLRLSLWVADGVVTDKVVVQKALFTPVLTDGEWEVEGNIDLKPQPTFQQVFQGQGRFSLSDRELKNMIKEVLDKLFVSIESLDFEISKLNISANNYPVATYVNGIVVLEGEPEQ